MMSKPLDADEPKPPLKPRFNRRANMLYFPDGSERNVRYQSRAKGESNQVLADFFGVAPDLSTSRHSRSMASILSELSVIYDVQEQSIAPELLSRAWEEEMGTYIATQAQLISLVNETALIRCLHPALRFELNKRKRSIIIALNKRFGEGCVKRVRLQHG